VENRYVEAIRTLRSVPRVKGSFVLTEDGVILAVDMPGTLPTSVMQLVGTRLLVLGESMNAEGDPCTNLELQFGDHTLFGCRVKGALLCVQAEPDVDPPALQTAVSRVVTELATLRGM